MTAYINSPTVPVRGSAPIPFARWLSRLIGRFGRAVQRTLIRHQEEVLERQLEQERLSWAAMELFAAACVLSRWDHELTTTGQDHPSVRWFLTDALNHAERNLKELHAPIDAALLNSAKGLLES